MASEEVRFQIAAEDWGVFHSFGARREKSLGRVERCPGFFREGTTSFPASADLSTREGLYRARSNLRDMGLPYLLLHTGRTHGWTGCKTDSLPSLAFSLVETKTGGSNPCKRQNAEENYAIIISAYIHLSSMTNSITLFTSASCHLTEQITAGCCGV